ARARRHLLGRGREVPRRDAGIDEGGRRSDQPPPDSLRLRHRRSRAHRAGEVPAGLRAVRTALRAADPRREPESAEGQLRAAVRRRTPERQGLGAGQRQGEITMRRIAVAALCLWAASPSFARAQTPTADKPTLDIYGFAQVDAIADINQINPDW